MSRASIAAIVSILGFTLADDQTATPATAPATTIAAPTTAATTIAPATAPATTIAPATAATTIAPATAATTIAPATAPATTIAPTTAPTTTIAPTTPATTDVGSEAESVKKIIRDIWPDHLEDQAIRVAYVESRFVPTAYNFCCHGVFQIYFELHKDWLVELGVTSVDELYDATVNTRAALWLYERDGWRPWGF